MKQNTARDRRPQYLWLVLLFGLLTAPLAAQQPNNPLDVYAPPIAPLAYASWSGLGTPDANSSCVTERFAADPEIQQFVNAVLNATFKMVNKELASEDDPRAKQLADMLPQLVNMAATSPAACYVSGAGMGQQGPFVEAAVIIDLAANKQTAEKLMAMFEPIIAEETDQPDGQFKTSDAGLKILKMPGMPDVLFGILADKFVIASGAKTPGMVAKALKEKPTAPPAWLSEAQKATGTLPNGMYGYVNIQRITMMTQMFAPAVVMGLQNEGGFGSLQYLSIWAGLGKKNAQINVLLGAPAGTQWNGIVGAMANAKPLTADDLKMIPADATVAMIKRTPWLALYDAQIATVKAAAPPQVAQQVDQQIDNVNQTLGFNLRDDLLANLGDTACIYLAPSQGGALGFGTIMAIKVKDRDAIAKIINKITPMALQIAGAGPNAAQIIQNLAWNQQQIKFLDLAKERRWNDAPITPAWCLTDQYLYIAAYPQPIASALSKPADAKTLADNPIVSQLLKEKPLGLAYSNTRPLLETAYPFLPLAANFAFSYAQEEGIDLNIGILPSAPAILQYAKPAASIVRVTKNGILFESNQPLPGLALTPENLIIVGIVAGIISQGPSVEDILPPAMGMDRPVAVPAENAVAPEAEEAN